MITIHKKIVPAQHGYHQLILPAGAKVISVGSSGAGSIPVYVKLENTETVIQRVNIFVCLTNLKCAEEENAMFIGTCQIDAQNAAHVFCFE